MCASQPASLRSWGMVAMSAGKPATDPENGGRAEVGFDVDGDPGQKVSFEDSNNEGDCGWGMLAMSAGKLATDPDNEDFVNDEGAK